MKRYLSLMLSVILLISAVSFSAFAEGITVSSSEGTISPAFSESVYNYDIILPENDSQMPLLSVTGATVEKQAEFLGDKAIIKTTDDVYYYFTVRTPYEVSSTKAFDLTALETTSVQSASVGSALNAGRVNFYLQRVYADNPKTIYGLLKFDLSEKDVDPNGKFELKLVQYGSYGDGKEIEVTVKAANIPDNWTYKVTDVPDGQFTAKYNNTLGAAGSSIEESVSASFTTGLGSGTAYTIDVSEIVRNRLLNNMKKFTLALEIDSSSLSKNYTYGSTSAIQVFFCNHEHTTAKNRPTLTYYPVKKGTDATLKAVEVSNGIIDTEFAPDKLSYKVGVPEGKLPEFKFIPADSHANIEYTPATAIGETATVKVTSHNGLAENTYSFEYVTLEQAGITENGIITVSDTHYENIDGNLSSLIENDTVNFKATVRNNNINNKNIVVLTAIFENGVFKNIADIKEATLSVGNNKISSNDIILPASVDGVSLESYIFEKISLDGSVNYQPVADKTEFPVSSYEPEILSATEKIQYKLDGNDIVFYGVANPGENIPFVLIKPDYTLADFTAINHSSVAAFDLIKANEQGIWENRFTIPTSTKYYTAYAGTDESLLVLHTALSDKLGVLQTVYDNIFDNTDETAINALKTTLGLKSEEVINDVVLGLDTTTVTLENENAILSLLVSLAKEKFMAKPTVATEVDIAEFSILYDSAIILSKINSGSVVLASEILSVFSFNDLAELFSSVTDISWVENSLLNKGITKKAELYNYVKDSIILSLINTSGNPDFTMNLISTYGSYLGLDMAGYTRIERWQTNLISDLSDFSPFVSIEDIKGDFSTLIFIYSNSPYITVPGGGSGGGGGSRPSANTSTVPAGGGITGAGEIHTEDIKPVISKVFNDVEPDNWAYEPTKFLSEKGILNGVGNGKFAPDTSVKREEFAKILCLAFELEEKEENIEFADVSESDWYYGYVKTAYQNGAVNGIGDSLFGTGAALKRQDIAVILARILNLSEESEEKFSDDSEISDYAKDAVYTLKALGILNGTGNGAFEPMRSVTRAECAKIVYELIKEAK